MKKIQNFYLKAFSFWAVKFSTYLNRRVFVMVSPSYNVYSFLVSISLLLSKFVI